MSQSYDVFLNHEHTSLQGKLLTNFNYQVIEYILRGVKKKNVEVLELGVGKGYFAKAALQFNSKRLGKKIIYSAFDRNKAMLKNLANFDKTIETHQGDLPSIKLKSSKKYDVVYCAFVIEHLRDGMAVYELVENIKKVLAKDGVIVFQSPNAMNQRFEFYNIDYTHTYPTTARNINMMFNDHGMYVDVLKINGLCTYRFFYNPIVRILHKVIFFLYSYHLFAFIAKPFYRKPLYKLDNFFYQVYCFFKEENLMFIARNNK